MIAEYKFWPSKSRLSYDFFVDLIQTDLKIKKNTKIASIGSCFAREIKKYLLKNGYNYLLGETGKNVWCKYTKKAMHVLEHSSVAWERVYNTFTLKHIVEYTFGERDFSNRFVECKTNEKYIADLIRNAIYYKNIEIAKFDLDDHIKESRRVFTEAELLIITLGLVEVCKYKDDFFLAQNRTCYGLANSDLNFIVSGYKENMDNLCYVYDVLKRHNPKLKFLITVSPVPLSATFRKDVDVLSANLYSKSVLRTVANDFTGSFKDTYYFPSIEIANVLCPMLGIVNCEEDLRHINQRVVNMIMEAFRVKCLTISKGDLLK